MSPGAVKTAVYRARRKLKKAVEELNETPDRRGETCEPFANELPKLESPS